MIARVHTNLPASVHVVWDTLLKRDTFLHITHGMLGFTDAEQWPDVFRDGTVIETRLVFFHLLPAWSHTLEVVRVDPIQHELTSEERGGPIRRWNHRILVRPRTGETSLYTDEIDIDAGWLTVPVWVWAHLFYRYRQARWRKLAKTL